jgi:hypothetical protein
VEFYYNSSFQSTLKTSPFQVIYGRERDEFLMEIREHLVQTQQHYNMYYDRGHSEFEFEEEQWVWLCLLHWPMASLDVKGRGKLGPWFYSPFQILKHIGDVAYQLKLPPGARIQAMFHVGLFKKYNGEPPTIAATLPPIRHGRVCLEPQDAIKCRMARAPRRERCHGRNHIPP